MPLGHLASACLRHRGAVTRVALARVLCPDPMATRYANFLVLCQDIAAAAAAHGLADWTELARAAPDLEERRARLSSLCGGEILIDALVLLDANPSRAAIP